MVATQLNVQPTIGKASGALKANVSLSCVSSTKPILCLWKTPYGHIYTLSDGVFAESGRLRHSAGVSNEECGVDIIGVEERDAGKWECEVGAVVGEDFQTKKANILLSVQKSKTNNSKKILFVSQHKIFDGKTLMFVVKLPVVTALFNTSIVDSMQKPWRLDRARVVAR